jgi:hypothetical protein
MQNRFLTKKSKIPRGLVGNGQILAAGPILKLPEVINWGGCGGFWPLFEVFSGRLRKSAFKRSETRQKDVQNHQKQGFLNWNSLPWPCLTHACPILPLWALPGYTSRAFYEKNKKKRQHVITHHIKRWRKQEKETACDHTSHKKMELVKS